MSETQPLGLFMWRLGCIVLPGYAPGHGIAFRSRVIRKRRWVGVKSVVFVCGASGSRRGAGCRWRSRCAENSMRVKERATTLRHPRGLRALRPALHIDRYSFNPALSTTVSQLREIVLLFFILLTNCDKFLSKYSGDFRLSISTAILPSRFAMCPCYKPTQLFTPAVH